MKLNKTREHLINLFIESLEQEQLPWHQPWKMLYQQNGVTGYRYKGINAFLLSYVCQIKGYKDPRWLTFNQISKNGYHLQKGTKGVPVEYWMIYDEDTKKYLSIDEANRIAKEHKEDHKPRFKLVSKTSIVFNGSCIDGIKPYMQEKEFTPMKNSELQETLDTLIDTMKIKVVEHQFDDGAFYIPSKDEVHIPCSPLFRDETYYATTLLHELAHATSHQSRLNRQTNGKFGDKEYAKEELRAEIASSFLSDFFPYQVSEEHLQNHTAYIQSWMSILKEEPNELFKAIKEADKIAEYMIECAGIDLKCVNEMISGQEPGQAHEQSAAMYMD